MANRLYHEPPRWIKSDAVYFITVCAKTRGQNQFCRPEIASIIWESIVKRQSERTWYCSLALLMPDHIHMLMGFPPEVVFAKAIRDWKNWLGRKQGLKWQDGFFDHRLRQEESLDEKACYILQNPVRAELVDKMEDWPFIWRPKE